MNFRATRILAAALLASSCGLAIGATKTTTFAVTATVVSNCFINSASAMAFGSYTPGTSRQCRRRPDFDDPRALQQHDALWHRPRRR